MNSRCFQALRAENLSFGASSGRGFGGENWIKEKIKRMRVNKKMIPLDAAFSL
jgi:hypothetical protein